MKWLSILLVLGLLLAPCSASSEPLASSPSVTLSTAEYDQIVAAIEEADRQLGAPSETIAKLERDSRKLWIFSGVLALALVADGIAEIIQAAK